MPLSSLVGEWVGAEVIGSTEGVRGFLVEDGMVEDFSFFVVSCVGAAAAASFFLFNGGVLVTRRGRFLWALLVGVPGVRMGVNVESLAGVISLVEGL